MRNALLSIALTLTASSVHAQTMCTELGGNIVYGVGGSAQTPLLGQLAARLRETADPAHQLTVVFAEPGPCHALALDAPIGDSPSGTTARYWNAGNTSAQTCVLEADVTPDFSVAQRVPGLCTAQLADGLGTFEGPVSTFNLVVPNDSTQKSISAEALYFLLKLGDAAQVAPWDDERYFFHRGNDSAVTRWIAATVGVSGEIEHGSQGSDSSGNILQAIASGGVHGGTEPNTVADPEATLGLVSGEDAANNGSSVRTLAFQHFDQACGYYPDSSATAFDKLNVRTGRYALWSAIHYYARVDDDEAIADEHVARLIGYATGALEPPPELPILDIVIDNYNVPQCAMQVQRDTEGVLSSYRPEAPCSCYFEQRATGRTTCTTCDADDDCSSDAACHYGYCEP